MKVITISRQFGAGGAEIGKRVAQALGIEYYDKDFVMKTVLQDPKLDNRMVADWENRTPSKASVFHVLCEFYSKPMNDQIWDAMQNAIRHMADHGSCVIVGRDANYVLREYEHTLHVFIDADFKWRVKHVHELSPEDSLEEIAEETKRVDKARKRFCEYYTGEDYGYAPNFDICLNSSKLGIDKCVDIILKLAEDL